MPLVAIKHAPDKIEHRLFECRKCSETRQVAMARDPLDEEASHWISGELRPPQ